MTTSKGKLDAVYPALLAILNNIGAYVERLSPSACSKILQLFASMSSPSFLLANDLPNARELNQILSALVGFINLILEYQFTSMY